MITDLWINKAFASAFGDFVMHPVDTVKVFQQTSTSAISLLAAWGQVFKKAGILGFYSGVGPYVVAGMGTKFSLEFTTLLTFTSVA